MKRSALALALCSSSLAWFQILLMQILSLTQWHHFAALAVSLALLGYGVSGTILSLFRKTLLPRAGAVPPWVFLVCGITMAGAVPLAHRVPFRFDSLLVFADMSHLLGLVLTCILYAVPVLLGAFSIGLVLIARAEKAGMLYAATLFGSACGAVAGIVLAAFLMPEQAAPLVAVPAVLAGCLTAARLAAVRWGIAVLSLGGMAFLVVHPAPLSLSQYKPLARTKLLPEVDIITEVPSRSGVLTVASSPSLRYAPGVSLTDPVAVPAAPGVYLNGEWVGAMFDRDTALVRKLLDRTTMVLPFVFRSPERVLVPGAGTGMGVLHAAAHGAVEIDAVEEHHAVAKLLDRWSGRWMEAAGIRLTREPVRAFVKSAHGRYDLVLLPLFGAFGGTSGLDAMHEEYVLTREAFTEIWDKLDDGGAVAVSAWVDYPPRLPVRLFAWAFDGLRSVGITDLTGHVAAVRSWGTVTILVTHSSITAAEEEAVRSMCDRLGFDPLFLPNLKRGERNSRNVLTDSTLLQAVDGVTYGEGTAFRDSYLFDVASLPDDRPFLHQFLKLEKLSAYVTLLGSGGLPFLEAGYFIVLVTLLVVTVLAFVLILAPLRLLPAGARTMRAGVFFACLGVGYMLIEIVFMQRLVLPLGDPITAASVVLGSMLLGSGLGSLWSARLRPAPAAVRWVSLLVVPMLVLTLLADFPHLLLPLPAFARITLGSLSMIPLGFVMGFPFPTGLRALEATTPEALPWAWGINGYASVVGSALAPVLSVEAGFAAVMVAAGILYGVAAATGAVRPGAPAPVLPARG